MPVRLQFEGIRCFSEPQDAIIRPLTLLVGENSSGKSTFLALCRIASSLTRGFAQRIPFNEPPFLLGAYDQIASYRGGSAGRAKSFSIGVSNRARISWTFWPEEYMIRSWLTIPDWVQNMLF